jgi:hypothetical protein
MNVSLMIKETNILPNSKNKFIMLKVLKDLTYKKILFISKQDFDLMMTKNIVINEIVKVIELLKIFENKTKEWRKKIKNNNDNTFNIFDIISIYSKDINKWKLYATEEDIYKKLSEKNFKIVKLRVTNFTTLFWIDNNSTLLEIKNDIIIDKINLLMEELNKLNSLLLTDNYNIDELNKIKQQIKEVSKIIIDNDFTEFDIVKLINCNNYISSTFFNKLYNLDEIQEIMITENI